MHPLARIDQRIEEMQEQPRIGVHRAGDVAQHDQRRMPHAPRLVERQHRFGAARSRRAQHAAQIQALAAAVAEGGKAARPDFRQRDGEIGDDAAGKQQLRRRHLLEILRREHFQLARGARRIELDLVSLHRLHLGAMQKQAVRQPARHRIARMAFRAARIRRHHGEKLLQIAGIAPDQVESLVENLALRRPGDEDGVQRPIERLGVADARRHHRFGRQDHLLRADFEAGGAQQPGEAEDVGGDFPAIRLGRDDVGAEALAGGESLPRRDRD